MLKRGLEEDTDGGEQETEISHPYKRAKLDTGVVPDPQQPMNQPPVRTYAYNQTTQIPPNYTQRPPTGSVDPSLGTQVPYRGSQYTSVPSSSIPPETTSIPSSENPAPIAPPRGPLLYGTASSTNSSAPAPSPYGPRTPVQQSAYPPRAAPPQGYAQPKPQLSQGQTQGQAHNSARPPPKAPSHYDTDAQPTSRQPPVTTAGKASSSKNIVGKKIKVWYVEGYYYGVVKSVDEESRECLMNWDDGTRSPVVLKVEDETEDANNEDRWSVVQDEPTPSSKNPRAPPKRKPPKRYQQEEEDEDYKGEGEEGGEENDDDDDDYQGDTW